MGYISNETKRFHTFVANRVQFIRDSTDINSWNYVSSSENPADYASRGLSTSQKEKIKMWFEGPQFLKEPEEKSPKQSCYFEVENEDPEGKKQKVNVNASKITEFDSLVYLENKVSCWFRLKRIVARILSWKSYKRTNSMKLEIKDIQKAEKKIIKLHQRRYFAEEIDRLTKNDCFVKKGSSLHKSTHS